jgi:predicted membrane channel-forming protein YqfA (hemolysin III family)
MLPLTNAQQLEFSIYIGSIAVTLLNFGDKPSRLSFVAAGTFTFVAIVALLYSVGIYIYRARAIRARKAARYHDKWGPSVLCGILGVAVCVNLGVELRGRGYV